MAVLSGFLRCWRRCSRFSFESPPILQKERSNLPCLQACYSGVRKISVNTLRKRCYNIIWYRNCESFPASANQLVSDGRTVGHSRHSMPNIRDEKGQITIEPVIPRTVVQPIPTMSTRLNTANCKPPISVNAGHFCLRKKNTMRVNRVEKLWQYKEVGTRSRSSMSKWLPLTVKREPHRASNDWW